MTDSQKSALIVRSAVKLLDEKEDGYIFNKKELKDYVLLRNPENIINSVDFDRLFEEIKFVSFVTHSENDTIIGFNFKFRSNYIL